MLKTGVLEMCEKTDFWRTLETEKGGNARSGKLKTEFFGMKTRNLIPPFLGVLLRCTFTRFLMPYMASKKDATHRIELSQL